MIREKRVGIAGLQTRFEPRTSGMHPTPEKAQWRDNVNTVMDLWVPYSDQKTNCVV
jgi:hypothetical protein